VHKSLHRLREKKMAEFITWGPASIQVGAAEQRRDRQRTLARVHACSHERLLALLSFRTYDVGGLD
jgi:hypothetical protein